MASVLAELSKPPVTPESDTQRVCIDLPGESVKCWRSKDKMEVVLRKHRDVILQFKLKQGATYTVESEVSEVLAHPSGSRSRESIFSFRDFYIARDKKLVEARFRQKVTFKDGELLHLWVGREFNGTLLVKQGESIIGRYKPNELDLFQYGPDPATKPPPMIIVVDSSHPGSSAVQGAPAPTQTMHIVEVNLKLGKLPEEIADFFKKGGEDTAIDAAKLMTRNWLWAQITGGVAYTVDNFKWIRELWAQKFHLSKIKGKTYIIFKGNADLRDFLKGTRYLVDHPEVIAISAGAGSIQGVHKAAWEATKGAFKGAAKFALVLTVALDFAEWLADYEERDPKTGKPKRDFYDLGAKIFTDIAWAALGAVIGTAIMAVAMPALAAVGLACGGVVVVGAIAAAVVVGLGLAFLDSKFGVTAEVAKASRSAGEYLDGKFQRDYVEYKSSVNGMLFLELP